MNHDRPMLLPSEPTIIDLGPYTTEQRQRAAALFDARRLHTADTDPSADKLIALAEYIVGGSIPAPEPDAEAWVPRLAWDKVKVDGDNPPIIPTAEQPFEQTKLTPHIAAHNEAVTALATSALTVHADEHAVDAVTAVLGRRAHRNSPCSTKPILEGI